MLMRYATRAIRCRATLLILPPSPPLCRYATPRYRYAGYLRRYIRALFATYAMPFTPHDADVFHYVATRRYV